MGRRTPGPLKLLRHHNDCYMIRLMTHKSDPHHESCMACLFWLPRGGDSRFGECRRHSPIVARDNPPSAQWPVTTDEDACGDFTDIVG